MTIKVLSYQVLSYKNRDKKRECVFLIAANKTVSNLRIENVMKIGESKYG